MDIRVTRSSIDHYRKTRKFKTLKGAQRFATEFVGQTPEVSEAFGYAVSGDGTAKVEVEGCPIADLFPALNSKPAPAAADDDDGWGW
jgi:hypothetical protein